MSRRDDVDQAEYVMISLDTYHDHRTAYGFGVTASGVRLDRYYASDDEDNYDTGFDPVWAAQTSVARRRLDGGAVDSVFPAPLPRRRRRWSGA